MTSTEQRRGDSPPADTTAREHFIPLRPAELVQKLADDPALTIPERQQFRQFCQLVEATIHHEYWTRLQALKAAYAPFDPDSDAYGNAATEGVSCTAAGGPPSAQALFEQFDELLMRANYRRLPREELERAVEEPNQTGLHLHLNLDIFERLEIYVRGNATTTKTCRTWRSLWQPRSVSMPVHRRLALIFRLQQVTPATDRLDTRAVVLKLFKDIPHQDVETLLPGACIRIGLIEQAKIVLPTLSGVGLTIIKLLKGAAAVAFVSLYGLIAFLALISGAIGYGVRSFFGYLRTREKHQLSLTRHLYFQNLDNNSGVIYHLLNEAEEQEFREMVLAYWLLWRGRQSGATTEQLDTAAETWLRERCSLEVDFEISDALAKLQRLGLAQSTLTRSVSKGVGSRWQAAPIESALETLDRAWD
ncbi:MAG TPA: DUF3754 domain-containing protein, partial [Pirellulaceae bacterium]|nr:DUF3754 domain-containing protein [Pirellulaceae bacterium]